MLIEKIIIILLIFINIVSFAIVAIDKHKAKKHMWRIPERTLFLLALLGGSPGVYSGMLMFRHKTRYWYFMIGIPAIFVAQLILVLHFFT